MNFKIIVLFKFPWLRPLVLLTRRIWWGVTGVISLIKAIQIFRRENYACTMFVQTSWNVMAHGDALEAKWRGNWRLEWVASILYTTSEHGVSSITIADAHNSAASSRLNCCPCRFKWTRPFRRKTKSVFCACAITFQTQSTARLGSKLVSHCERSALHLRIQLLPHRENTVLPLGKTIREFCSGRLMALHYDKLTECTGKKYLKNREVLRSHLVAHLATTRI